METALLVIGPDGDGTEEYIRYDDGTTEYPPTDYFEVEYGIDAERAIIDIAELGAHVQAMK